MPDRCLLDGFGDWGIALPDDRIHAPNERIVLDQLWKGLLAAGELWRELAGLR